MIASTISRPRTVFHQLTVANVARLCDDAVAVTFEVPPELAQAYEFAPGQSLTLRRTVEGREERRSYSICSPPGTPPRVGVREIPGGLFSTWLVRQVRPGDRIEVGTPTGTFTPPAGLPGAHHVFVAAGSGITPVLSIAAALLGEPGTTVTLFYGNRRASTVMFADELADLKDRYPARFELIHVLSREPREVELFSGRLDARKLTQLLRLVPDPRQVDHWWLCGPFGMVTDAREVLSELGIARSKVHQELFFVDDVPPAPVRHAEVPERGATSEVTVKLDGRTTTVAVSKETAVLDGAQRSRPDLPFACKGGVCGTCRARLVEGEVDMRRNFALEDEEVAAGFVLTCQSRPVSDRVRVDYDA
ncbi:ring-1,2-phenylacetyl-CoA epoxidase subunit PaaE [Saccharomonospora amisosensis]|uniref:3-ketosteroid-9-alpha-monooxygenase, ferredoxin reductase component n=1 Tax=Saccharomonospora amisosensis TaxID=1128677 RepID=A0A7X5ULI3_9PSEU|nr:1,2-phenylacetyl-CoA epoxidase subunit PaaE [Saccharomonospora amisosensis]NIJ10219.1 ring-1,2-phenylacetyl-CoA epoxidase subunit PaaE [Saccharomonospora amisosensis]